MWRMRAQYIHNTVTFVGLCVPRGANILLGDGGCGAAMLSVVFAENANFAVRRRSSAMRRGNVVGARHAQAHANGELAHPTRLLARRRCGGDGANLATTSR